MKVFICHTDANFFFMKFMFEIADSHKKVDQNIMRTCTADVRRLRKFLEIPFIKNLNLRCAITKYFLQIRSLGIELAPSVS